MFRWRISCTAVFPRAVSVIQHESAKEYSSKFWVNFPTMADRDSHSQEQDVSFKDVMKAVRAQGELSAKLSHDISPLRLEVHVPLYLLILKLKR